MMEMVDLDQKMRRTWLTLLPSTPLVWTLDRHFRLCSPCLLRHCFPCFSATVSSSSGRGESGIRP